MSDRFGPSETCEGCGRDFSFGELEQVLVFSSAEDGDCEELTLCEDCKEDKNWEAL